MDPYYYLVKSHKVKLLNWSEVRQKFLVELEDGSAQFVPESLLQKTDELVPVEPKPVDYRNT